MYQTRKLHPTLAVEIEGVDLTLPAAQQPIEEIRRAIDGYGVAVFRNEQPPTDEQHVEFSRMFGPVEIGPAFKITGDLQPRIAHRAIVDVSNLGPDNEIMAASNRRRLFAKGNQLWHTDMSFMQNRATYSLLAAHEIPPVGAETEFADMAAAYDALPDPMKEMLEGLTVEHLIWHSRRLAGFPEPTQEELDSQGPAFHQLVHVHPGTSRKILYIGAHAAAIVGWPRELGLDLLNGLLKFATQPQFVYRHTWRLGDLLMWDNLATLHRGTEFEDTKYRRDMRRTTCRERQAEAAAA